jgi:hypothetical protein
MKLASAARALKVALSTAALMSRTGQLEVDPETDSSAARFVTRVSVQQCWLDRQSKTRSRGTMEQAVPLAEVARFTGKTPRALMDLVRAGTLRQLPGRHRCEITVDSLDSWLGGGAA